MVDKISGSAFLNAGYFLIIEGTENAFDKLGITPSPDVGDRKDVFAGAGQGQILEIDSSNDVYGKTQKQNAMSTQMTAKEKAILTLKETYTWKSKNIHRKVSVSFPHNCPVIFQTKVLADYVTAKDSLLKFKGYYTWKRSPGGRFAIVDVPANIITNMINERITAKSEALKKGSENTTSRTDPQAV